MCTYCGKQFSSHSEELDHINLYHTPVTSWASRAIFNPEEEQKDYSHLGDLQRQNADEKYYYNHNEAVVKSYYRY